MYVLLTWVCTGVGIHRLCMLFLVVRAGVDVEPLPGWSFRRCHSQRWLALLMPYCRSHGFEVYRVVHFGMGSKTGRALLYGVPCMHCHLGSEGSFIQCVCFSNEHPATLQLIRHCLSRRQGAARHCVYEDSRVWRWSSQHAYKFSYE